MTENRKLVFYGAISVDGYLAKEDDALDWLYETEGGDETGYADFYATVDTILMGRRTYEQIVSVLSPEHFPYAGKECYVFSRTLEGDNQFVKFVGHDRDIVQFTKSLKTQPGQHIWMVGGGDVLRPLIDAQMVDEFIIQIAPSILGRGLPLFLPSHADLRLKLLAVRQFQQFAELHYEQRRF
ncbi:dihydrofolate reductase [Alicyclobacillus curvatus]|nr:dihydrofolate reductase [Alicyclobacillus curvatus]